MKIDPQQRPAETIVRKVMELFRGRSAIVRAGLIEQKADTAETWRSSQSFRVREYSTYEAYKAHQASKLGTLDLSKYDSQFEAALRARIDDITELKRGSTVLCLAARIGTECRAFIGKGCVAIGVDLNPGPNNKYVVAGDFHHLQYADSSFEAVFTNSLDHAFDMGRVLSEVRRVLRPGGLFIAEIVRGSADENGREPGAYESCWWDKVDDVIQVIEQHGFRVIRRRVFAFPWNGDQVVFTS